MSKFRSQVRAFQQTFIAGAVLAISLNWPSVSAAQNKSVQAKDSNPHAQHQEKQRAGDQDAGSQKQDMKMQGMSGQKQDSAWWFDKYSRGQEPDMGGMDMSDGEGGMAGMTGMAKGKMDAGSMAGNSSLSGMEMKDDIDLMGMMEVDLNMMGAIAIAGAGSHSMKGIGEMKVASSLPTRPASRVSITSALRDSSSTIRSTFHCRPSNRRRSMSLSGRPC